MRIKQSICYPALKPEDMRVGDFCAIVSEIGFSAIEMWCREDNFQEVVEAARKHNLTVASMIGHGTIQHGLNCRKNHDRIEYELYESINVAAEHGIPGLICFSGNRKDGMPDQESMKNTVDGLRRICRHAEQKGVNLNLELLNSKIDHPDYECDHTAWGVEVCQRVNSPRAKLLYDIYHMQIMEGDIIRTINKSISWIGHFHAAGCPGRGDIDGTQEINYAGICRAIAATGYDLYIGHEFWPQGDLIEALKTAYAICDKGSVQVTSRR